MEGHEAIAQTVEQMEGVSNPLKRTGITEKNDDNEPFEKKQRAKVMPPKDFDFDGLWTEMRRIGDGVATLQQTTAKLNDQSDKLERLSEESCLKLTDVRERLDKVEMTSSDAIGKADSAYGEMMTLKREIASLKSDVSKLHVNQRNNQGRATNARIVKLEGYSRRFNIVFEGIDEVENETDEKVRQKLNSFFKNILGMSDVRFDIAHRLGPNGPKGRKIIAKFTDLLEKDRVWNARSKLKTPENSKFKMFLDKPKEVKDREALAFRIVRAAQQTGRYRVARFHHSKVWLDDLAFPYESFNFLPIDLRPASLASPRNDDTVVFYSHYSPLSNHHPAPFMFDEERFAHMEQFLAYSRAKFADNRMLVHQIMSTDDPLDHSRYLRSMHNDGMEGRWRETLLDQLDAGLIEKFAQNKGPKDFLIDTGSRYIGEATTDTFWGIGMSIGDKRILNRTIWANGNVMGKALMSVRSKLLRSDFHHV